MKPIIGITAARFQDGTNEFHRINRAYVDAVVRAGGIPLLLTPTDEEEDIAQLVETLDGMIIPGGVDTAPCFYGEEPVPAVTWTDRGLDRFEIAIVRRMVERGLPVLGICRGHQLLNVVFGGGIIQDIPSQVPRALSHNQKAPRWEPFHHVVLEKESHLAKMLWRDRLDVNTFHHQAIRNVAPGLTAVGHSADGIVEAVESSDGLVIGVQWHPEAMAGEDAVQQRLFNSFVALCAETREKGETASTPARVAPEPVVTEVPAQPTQEAPTPAMPEEDEPEADEKKPRKPLRGIGGFA